MHRLHKVFFISVIVLILSSCGPAKKPPPSDYIVAPDGTVVVTIDGQGQNQPVPAPAPPAPSHPEPANSGTVLDNGLVRIVVSANEPLKYAVDDIAFRKTYASGDGRVYIDITPGHHMINACTQNWRFAVSNNSINFPLYVNGTQLTRVRPDPNGGMLYLYIQPDGRVLANPP